MSGTCGAVYRVASDGGGPARSCVLPAGHDGDHEDVRSLLASRADLEEVLRISREERARLLKRAHASERAITYTLDRADREPEGLGMYLEPLTEAWARLVEAEALGLGRDPRRHRIHRLGGDEAAVLAAWEAYERRERATVLVRGEDGTAEVKPAYRADVWIVHRTVTDVDEEGWSVEDGYTLTHGPSGRAARAGDDAPLFELAAQLAEAAPGLLEADPYGPERDADRRMFAVLQAVPA